MKREHIFVENRRSEILKMIRKYESVKVEELAQIFDLSTMTVRRDLQYLEDRHMIRRFHGGAQINPAYQCMTPEEELILYRRLLSRYAATKVSNGDTIFINGSRCALGLLDHMAAQNVHVITNNGKVVDLECEQRVTVTLTGGELRRHIMVGDTVMRCLLDATADKTFIGCTGVTPRGEFSYNIPMEIGINEAMIARTTKDVYILADHTKIATDDQQPTHYGSCVYERKVILITDEKADPYAVESLRDRGIEVCQVGLNDVNF